MKLRRVLVLAPVVSVLTLFGACVGDEVSIGLQMRAPQGLLDDATSVTLNVLDGASCDPASGDVSGSFDDAETLSFELQREGCSGNAIWCKDLTLDKDGNTKVFQVVAQAGGETLAQGCTAAAVDKDPLDVAIKVVRFVPPRCCNNGTLEPGEQCDTGAVAPTDCSGNASTSCAAIFPDAVCECDCLAKEILLSIPGSSPNLDNAPGTKIDVALAFAGGAGSTDVSLGLRSVFTDRGSAAPDINFRLLHGSLYPIETGSFTKQLRLPNCASVTATNGPPREQKQPAIAQLSSKIAGVVYASDQQIATAFDIYLSVQRDDGCATEAAIPVNASKDDSAENPAIAGGPDGSGLIVWTDGPNLRGRIWTSDGSLTPTNSNIDLGTSVAGARPRVAGSASGWVVAYQGSGDDIYYREVSVAASVGQPERVNIATDGIQQHPGAAMMPDGRFAITWESGGQILMQRYNAQAAPVAGDQDAPLTQNSPSASQPTIASAGTAGDFFVVAWAAADGSIWGRYLGGSSGFLFNSVSGQNDDFRASHPGIVGQRVGPAAAVGGEGFVALGWSDLSNDHAGVFVRRMPLPQ